MGGREGKEKRGDCKRGVEEEEGEEKTLRMIDKEKTKIVDVKKEEKRKI